jgi:hypothetical protein
MMCDWELSDVGHCNCGRRPELATRVAWRDKTDLRCFGGNGFWKVLTCMIKKETVGRHRGCEGDSYTRPSLRFT